MASDPVILVIRFSSLGDCLLLGPVLRGLRARFPGNRIVWLTRPEQAPIWNKSPLVDEVITWDPTRSEAPLERLHSFEPIALIADLQASPRSRKLVRSLKSNNSVEAAPPRWKRSLQIALKYRFLADEPPVPLRYLRAVEPLGVVDDGRGLELPSMESNRNGSPNCGMEKR